MIQDVGGLSDMVDMMLQNSIVVVDAIGEKMLMSCQVAVD